MKMQKLFLTLALFLSIIISVTAQAVSPGTYTITNKNSNLCLAIRGATQANGEEGTQWNCDGNADKNWKLIDAGSGYFKLQNQNSNLFLAVGGASRDYGGRCVQYVDQGQPDIQWRFVDAGAGWYKIQNKNSGLFLAIGAGLRTGGADLIQWGDEGQEDVKWKLTAVRNRLTLPPGFGFQPLSPLPVPQVSFRITPYQTEAHLFVEVSNAVANRPVTIRISNLPNIRERITTINANAEGKASFNFEYRSLANFCALTPEQRRTMGKLDVATPGNIIAREFQIFQFYATPIGGCR